MRERGPPTNFWLFFFFALLLDKAVLMLQAKKKQVQTLFKYLRRKEKVSNSNCTTEFQTEFEVGDG